MKTNIAMLVTFLSIFSCWALDDGPLSAFFVVTGLFGAIMLLLDGCGEEAEKKPNQPWRSRLG